MRLILLISLVVLVLTDSFAQSPQKMSYQAVVRDAGNNLVTNQAIGMRVSILQGAAVGPEVYKEIYNTNPQTNANGLVTIAIGTGTPVAGVFANINWGSGAYFIKVEIDPTGGTNYTITSTSQLLSVPYAFYAKIAGNGFSGNYNDLTNKPKGIKIGDMQYWNGSAWVMIPSGKPGQYLQLSASGTPVWAGIAYPTITTSVVSSITKTTAICGGAITSDGGDSVTSRGICWNTAGNPTIADNKTINGSDTGKFTSSLIGLTSGVTYYVRAYATNGLGTAYGQEISFKCAIGNVTYMLHKASNPTPEQLNAYNLITAAMDSAIWYYNQYTTITKALNIYYEPSVPTADGNSNGSIRFGNTSYMQKVTAMHETGHTVGVGTTSNWTTLMVGGIFQGTNTTNMIRSISGNVSDVIHGDGMHFWPYGLNYYSEYKSTADLVNHCRIVNAMKQDGL